MKKLKIIILFLSVVILTSCSSEYSFSFKANDSIDAIICPNLDRGPHCVTFNIDGNLTDDAFLIISGIDQNGEIDYIYNEILIKKGIVSKETYSDWYGEPMSIKYVTTTPNNRGDLRVDISFGYLRYSTK